MRRSEELFMIINDIDDDIIDEAKIKADTPVQMKPEPRSPIKGIIALAACIAVLAVEVFALVKFKLNDKPDPIQNDSSEYSSESNITSDSSDSSDTEDGEYTEEDLELQEILKDLKPGIDNVHELYIKKTYFSDSGAYFDYGGKGYSYSLLPEKRTNTNGQVAVPQTRAEMEKLVFEYFSEEAAEKLMSEVSKCSVIKAPSGVYINNYINFENAQTGFSKFLEADGRMYRCTSDSAPFLRSDELIRLSGGLSCYMVCETAKVIRRTDDTIYFSCLSADTNINDALSYVATHPSFFSKMKYSLKFERGGWKLNYYYADGYGGKYIEDDNPKYTGEFTGSAENKEVFDILKPLVEDFEEITGIFNDMHTYSEGPTINFRIGEDSFRETFFRISDEQRTEPSGLFAVPHTYDEMEKLLLTCLTPQAAATYMEYVGKGSLAKESDGTYMLTFEPGYEPKYPTFVEIEGRLYRIFSFSDRVQTIDPYSVRLTSRTDEIMEFTYEHTDSWDHGTGTKDGFLANDGSGWKMNYYYDLEFQPIFTEEDLELQAILSELAPGGELIARWVGYGHYDPDHMYRFKFSNSDEYGSEFDLIPVGKASDSGIEYPRTCEELEALMLKYLTQDIVDGNMMGVCKGTMTENPDGTYTVAVEGEPEYHNFVEIDGRLYVQNKAHGGAGVPVWDSAKIIEKTDSYIKFSYVHDHMMGFYRAEGLIKYERGGWRLSYDYHGFVLDE